MIVASEQKKSMSEFPLPWNSRSSDFSDKFVCCIQEIHKNAENQTNKLHEYLQETQKQAAMSQQVMMETQRQAARSLELNAKLIDILDRLSPVLHKNPSVPSSCVGSKRKITTSGLDGNLRVYLVRVLCSGLCSESFDWCFLPLRVHPPVCENPVRWMMIFFLKPLLSRVTLLADEEKNKRITHHDVWEEYLQKLALQSNYHPSLQDYQNANELMPKKSFARVHQKDGQVADAVKKEIYFISESVLGPLLRQYPKTLLQMKKKAHKWEPLLRSRRIRNSDIDVMNNSLVQWEEFTKNFGECLDFTHVNRKFPMLFFWKQQVKRKKDQPQRKAQTKKTKHL